MLEGSFLRPLAFGDVDDHARKAGRLAAGILLGPAARGHPAVRSVRFADAVLHVEAATFAGRLGDAGGYLFAVFLVDAARVVFQRTAVGVLRADAEEARQVAVRRDAVRPDLPDPGAHIGGAERRFHPRARVLHFPGRTPARRHVFRPAEDQFRGAIAAPDRSHRSFPVTLLEPAAVRFGPADVVPPFRQGGGRPARPDAVKGGLKLLAAGGGEVVGVAGEHLEERLPGKVRAPGHRRAQIGVAGGGDPVAFLGVHGQQDPRSGLEQRAEIDRRGGTVHERDRTLAGRTVGGIPDGRER